MRKVGPIREKTATIYPTAPLAEDFSRKKKGEKEMSKVCKFVSDNTPYEEPNVLTMVQRDDGDIEFCITVRHRQEHGISVRASGSRLKNYAKVISLFSQIIDLINEETKGVM